VKNIYKSGQYLENHPDWHEEDAPWKSRQILKILKRNTLSPKSVLDIGCGSGEILRILSRETGARCLGYDVSPQAIMLARKKEGKSLKFVDRIPSEKYDLALLIDVLEHLEEPEEYLKKGDFLADYLIIHLPLSLSTQAIWRRKPLELGRTGSGHLHNYSKKTALEMLEKGRLEIVDYFYTPGAILTPKKSWRQMILNIARIVMFPIFPDFTVKTLGGYSLMVLARRKTTGKQTY